jgi:hypothetical protein
MSLEIAILKGLPAIKEEIKIMKLFFIEGFALSFP